MLLLGLTWVVSRYPDVRGRKPFIALLALCSVYSFSAAAKLLAPPSVEYVLVWLELPFGVAVAVVFFVFASAYTGRDWHRTRIFAVSETIAMPLLGVALVTNPFHNFLWTEIRRSTAVFPHYVHSDFQPLFLVCILCSYLLAMTGIYMLLKLHVQTRYNTTSQLLVMFGGLLPFLVNIVSILDVAPIPGLDYTPFGLAAFGALTTMAISEDLFEIVPVARDTAVEQSSEGMIILDTNRCVHDYNQSAKHYFPQLPLYEERPIDDLVHEHDLPFDAVGQTQTQITIDRRSTCHLELQISPIRDGPHHLGWTVNMTDVTELQRRQHHLEVVSRVLRHNISNRITVITGHTDVLADHVDEDGQSHLASVTENVNSIVDTSEKIRLIQRIVADTDGKSAMHLSRILDDVVSRQRETHPAATIALDCPEDVWVNASWGLEATIANLVENAIIHNPSETPWVDVSVTLDDRVRVAVADNGPGIPSTEQRILENGLTETPLEHSSGVGLWLVYRFVEQSGDDLSFGQSHRDGSTVSFTLERNDRIR